MQITKQDIFADTILKLDHKPELTIQDLNEALLGISRQLAQLQELIKFI